MEGLSQEGADRREQGPKIGGARLYTHVAPARFVRCAHVTQVVHGARKRNMTNDEAPVNELTSFNKAAHFTTLSRTP